MRNVKWLLAAGLVAATTAACTAETGYPGSYGYPSTSYNRGYYSNNTPYYSSNTAYNNSGYYYNTAPRQGAYGDYDRDGVPNRYDRDANGDGVPDRFQR